MGVARCSGGGKVQWEWHMVWCSGSGTWCGVVGVAHGVVGVAHGVV